MYNVDCTIRGELPEDADFLETLTQEVFGPGMRTRAAYVLREAVDHEMGLSFVAERSGQIVGTVRLTKVNWGGEVILMLGPLAVLPALKGKGVGKSLMNAAVEAAQAKWAAGKGQVAIFLVGDLSYYGSFGFVRVPPAQISLPRPADPMRVLACEIKPGCLCDLSGAVTRYGQ
ncbi:MAG: N-acetyltransferase [Rhizobiaceae bacterium]